MTRNTKYLLINFIKVLEIYNHLKKKKKNEKRVPYRVVLTNKKNIYHTVLY
jgi:hypothetical protein